MKLNNNEISFIIGSILESEEVEDPIYYLNNIVGIDGEQLANDDVTIIDYEGNSKMYENFKINLIKKLYAGR